MQSFGDQTANPTSEAEANAIPPDDPSVVEADELPPLSEVPEGVSEADFLEQILPAWRFSFLFVVVVLSMFALPALPASAALASEVRFLRRLWSATDHCLPRWLSPTLRGPTPPRT